MLGVGNNRVTAKQAPKVKSEPTPSAYTVNPQFTTTHSYLGEGPIRSSSSASERAASQRNKRGISSGKMTITNSTTNKRMAIQSLLNDSSREGSGGRSSGRVHKCDQCHKSFTQSADVRKHKKTVHEKARDYHCDECSLSFGERGNLNKHIRSIHRKERNFFCDQCDATFPFRNGLTEHVRMKHTNERPYECSKCSSTFKKKSHLQRHVAVVHKS